VEFAIPSGKLPLIPLLTIGLKLGDLETEPKKSGFNGKYGGSLELGESVAST
jgi:hypothetical protein